MRLILALALLVGCKKTTEPEPAAAADDAMNVLLPVDDGIRMGTLDNGMRYFIEPNAKPANRAVLRLAVDAGSLLEDDDQLGVAHFLEHMAFNGTESFPSNELIAYLESVGTQFGPHLNAHTSFDETVYKLTVPTDDAEVFDKGLTILKEWACCLTLDGEEIEKERGVVLEEWRLRQGLQQRLTDIRVPLVYANSRYDGRLPIGTDESLKTFDPAVVGRFYDDWYRPDLMSVIVVGDVDVDAVEATIKERFGALENPKDPRERERFDIPAQDAPLYAVVTDPEITSSWLSVMTKMDHPQQKTWGDWLDHEAEQLALLGLNERLAELSRAPDSPFLRASGGRGRLSPTEGNDAVQLLPREGRELEALEAVLTEVKRFQVHGIQPPELERAKAVRIEGMDNYERNAADTDSRVHADEIVRHVLQGEMMPGTVKEAELTRKATNTVTQDDVNRWAAEFLTADSRVAMVFMPEKEGLEVPSVDDVKAVEARVAEAEVEAPVVEATLDALVDAPEPGTVTDRDNQYDERLGFKGFVLSNGTKVYMKPTDFKKGDIQFTAWREGGISAVPDADDDYLNAWAAGRIRSQSGLGEHDRGAVQRYLSGRTFSVNASLSDYRTRIWGSTGSDDLPTALEIAHLYQTSGRFTEDGMSTAMTSWRESLQNARNSPDRQFSDAWRTVFWPDDPRQQVLEVEQLEAVKLDRAEEVWNTAMGSPDEWVWFFVGDLPEDFGDTVQTWLGSVPKGEKGYTFVDRDQGRKAGVFRKELEVGSADRARYRTEFWTTLEADANTRKWRTQLNAFTDILSVRLRERLREDLGGVYGVSASSSTWTQPYHGSRTRIEFQCDPERLEELETAMMEVIEDMQANPVDASYVDSEKAKNREWHEDSIETNGRWLRTVSGSIRDGEDPHEILDYLDYNDSITAEVVQQLAKERLAGDNRGTVVLLPKGEGGE